MGVFDSYDNDAKHVVLSSYKLAEERKNNPVDIPHLFSVLMHSTNDQILSILSSQGMSVETIEKQTEIELHNALSLPGEFSISDRLHDVFKNSNDISLSCGNEETNIFHIFLSLIQSQPNISEFLSKKGITYDTLKRQIERTSRDEGGVVNTEKGKSKSGLENLTDLAKEGKLKSIIGRDQEVQKMIEILSRKEKNNVLVLGESGVGKTAIVELLAQKIILGEVPTFLKNKKILKINLGEIIAGSKFRGEFEGKVGEIIKLAKDKDTLLFIDEFHNISGAGKSEGSLDMSELLKPELSHGNIQIIGATTTSEYREHIEKDSGLARRFENIILEEPTTKEALTILRGIEQNFERHHGVIIYDTALVAAVELSNTYIKDRKLPDKAIALIDQAAAKVAINMTQLPSSITKVQTEITTLSNEKRSLEEEVELTTDAFEKTRIKNRIDEIKIEVADLSMKYEQEKQHWEELSDIFQKNLELQNSDQHTLPERQKQIQENQERLKKGESEFGIFFKNSVEREDIAQLVSEKTGIPLHKMVQEETKKLANMEELIGKKVIGQEEAISAISNAIRRARIGLKDPKKPMGSFLFLGPTGVGKTELAKVLAEFLFSDKKAMIRLNMSEYKEEHSVSKLIGSPPGYVGYGQGGQLTEAVRAKPYSVILLDEIEKAHEKVFDLFLQVFDDGMLNDSLGRTIDFKNTIVIMTSNIGSHEIMNTLQGDEQELGTLYEEPKALEKKMEEKEEKRNNEEKKAEQGEGKKKRNRRPRSSQKGKAENTHESTDKREQLREEIQPLLMDFFRPELLNRLDANIIFNPISPEMFKEILEIKINQQKQLISVSNSVSLELSPAAKNLLAQKGRDPKNGARPIDRALQTYLIDPLAMEIIKGEIKKGGQVFGDAKDGKICFQSQPST